MKAKNSILVLGFLVVVLVVGYTSGELLNVTPQPLKDLVAWADRNTIALLVSLCFVVACWGIVRIVGRKKIVEALKKSEYSACQL